MQQRRRLIASLAALALATGLSACGATGGGGADGSSGASAGTSSPVELPEPGRFASGDSCDAQAQGPWTPRTTEADLFAAVRAGEAPIFLEDQGGLPFEVFEYPTLDDYDDPSTLDDPATLFSAWEAAGYQEGVDWRSGEDGHNAAITLVRFRDADAAGEALTALLNDYCTKAYQSKVLADRSGMLVLRETGGVRALFVVDDILVSVMTCACFGDDEVQRMDLIEAWADQFMEEVAATSPTSATS